MTDPAPGARRTARLAVTASGEQWRPALWLRSLSEVTPAGWPVGRSIRAAIGVAAPLGLATASGHAQVGMWISMGVLLAAVGEREATYPDRFRFLSVSAPLGAAGYLLGYAGALPDAVVVLLMAGVAFLLGLVSGYGNALSIGAMQALLASSLALGIPAITHEGRIALLSLAGSGLFALLLAVEAAIDRGRPERDALVALVRALAVLAAARGRGRADLGALSAQTVAALDHYRQLTTQQRSQAGGPTRAYDRSALIARAADRLFARLLARDASAALSRTAAARLSVVADGVLTGTQPEPFTGDRSGLSRTLVLEDAIWAPTGREHVGHVRVPLGSLVPGPALLRSAGRLALCLGIAYAALFALPIDRGYWIVLTVALVMKPDLGSVFARAVQRTVGTVAGAAFALALWALPGGTATRLVAIAILAFLLPRATARGYAWQAVYLTPLVILLIGTVDPGNAAASLGGARIVATAVGGLIVIVAGYLVWPEARHCRVATPFGAALDDLAGYASAVATRADDESVGERRQRTYRALSDVRVSLQRTLAEPPPAGRESWAWIPVVSTAERVCDRLTDLSASRDRPTAASDAAALAELAERIEHVEREVAGDQEERTAFVGSRARSPEPGVRGPDPVVVDLADEVAHLASQLSFATPTRRAGPRGASG